MLARTRARTYAVATPASIYNGFSWNLCWRLICLQPVGSMNLFTGLVWVNWDIQMRSLYSPQKNWTSSIHSCHWLANPMLWFTQNGMEWMLMTMMMSLEWHKRKTFHLYLLALFFFHQREIEKSSINARKMRTSRCCIILLCHIFPSNILKIMSKFQKNRPSHISELNFFIRLKKKIRLIVCLMYGRNKTHSTLSLGW